MTFLTRILTAATLALGAQSAAAQDAPRETRAKGAANQDIRLGVFTSMKSDCTSGPLPTIRLVSPPKNGAVRVVRARVTVNNAARCLAAEVPGYVALYKSNAGFAGTDSVELEIVAQDKPPERRQITISVGEDGSRI